MRRIRKAIRFGNYVTFENVMVIPCAVFGVAMHNPDKFSKSGHPLHPGTEDALTMNRVPAWFVTVPLMNIRPCPTTVLPTKSLGVVFRGFSWNLVVSKDSPCISTQPMSSSPSLTYFAVTRGFTKVVERQTTESSEHQKTSNRSSAPHKCRTTECAAVIKRYEPLLSAINPWHEIMLSPCFLIYAVHF